MCLSIFDFTYLQRLNFYEKFTPRLQFCGQELVPDSNSGLQIIETFGSEMSSMNIS